jgi:MinD-like ATPase involved in chromosome partitioning or flagellar assembly
MTKQLGQIITFYSYKGGVGRTMTLANTAVLLARQRNKVLAIDWDLEAPGLERYFEPYMEKRGGQGLIDFLTEAQQLPAMAEEEEDVDILAEFCKQVSKFIAPVSKLPHAGGSVDLLRAGNVASADYADKILSFDWVGFFKKIPGFFPFFAYYLKQQYDYVLIDSRTGHTDAGGVCTMLLPDALVLAFIPNRQNLDGVIAVAEKASNYRKQSGDVRPLRIFPLPSRIELQEKEEREKWYALYQKEFEAVFQKIYDLPSISMARYFDETLIRQDTYFAYGEKIAVLDEKVTSNVSLTKAYSDFLEQLTASDRQIWDYTSVNGRAGEGKGKVLMLYAPADKIFYGKINLHFTTLKNAVSVWQDLALHTGTNMRQLLINTESADIVILLFSADFLNTEASDALYNFIRDKKKIGIVVRPCLWEFYTEGPDWQVFPQRSMAELNDIEQDKVIVDISKTIKNTIESIKAKAHERQQ